MDRNAWRLAWYGIGLVPGVALLLCINAQQR